MSYNSTGAVK